MQFKDKVCIVTGASHGIGYQIAQDLLKEGANVINLDIEPSDVTQDNYTFIACDLSKEEALKNATEAILKRYSSIDIIVNNACKSHGGILSLCDANAFSEILNIGVRAPYLLALYLKDYMPLGSSIVNIASTRGLMSQADTESYSAAKGGILALTHALSVSLGPKIRVNAISPGWIDTTHSQFEGADMTQHPVGRVGRPSDISQMVIYLASSQSGFITGQNFIVDGGMSVNMIYHNDQGWSYDPS